MKFFVHAIAVVMAVAGGSEVPAFGQEAEPIVVEGDVATTAEVYPVSPGIAVIEMGPIYGVFLDTFPEGINAHLAEPDKSGKGTAYVAKLKRTPFDSAFICWRGVRKYWHALPACGVKDGSRVSVTIDVGSRRNELFGMVPVAIDRETGTQVAWIAHPENTQTQAKCRESEDTVSVFSVDGAGTISIATPAQMASYRSQYCQGSGG
ncbi:MAG: hypothetical protein A2808_03420 [Candidatus Moranbacteria bacterium RIFCSPHIGHO2_01_FULL_55_24]|nr:MAG: hypothetical protein A2808_03420 [Candidatus Moranbacteria bacterium RIFCSPHIGHO2_01_FULL_55_24]